MKNILALIASIFIFPCVTNAQKISGKIANLSQQVLIVSTSNDYINKNTDTIHTSINGDFEYKFKINKPGFLTLKGKGFTLSDIYIYPNANVVVIADANDIYKSRKYSGDLGFINNYYAKIQNIQILKERSFSSKTETLSEDDFVNIIDRYFSTRDSIKVAYFKNSDLKNQIIKTFITTDSIEMTYLRALALLSYLGDNKNEENLYHKYIKPITTLANDDVYLNSAQYRYFWNSIIDYKLTEIRKKLPEKEAKTALPYYHNIPQLIEENLNGEIKRITARNYIENISSLYGTSTAPNIVIDSALEKLYAMVANKDYIEKNRFKIDQIRTFKNSIKPGAVFKDFVAVDSTGKMYSLKEFKNQSIYLDFWASWCGPCINEFKYVDSLVQDFNADSFTYITISIDEHKKDWINALKQHKPSGLHLWIEGGYKNELMKYYKINSIPHYFLIGPGNKLVSFSAPRPSQKKQLINLLNKKVE